MRSTTCSRRRRSRVSWRRARSRSRRSPTCAVGHSTTRSSSSTRRRTAREQMKMFLTRLGFNSKMVITGDITQVDLPASRGSGLIEVQTVLRGVEGIDFVYFDEGDVVRHRLVSAIVRAYDAHGARARDNGNAADGA